MILYSLQRELCTSGMVLKEDSRRFALKLSLWIVHNFISFYSVLYSWIARLIAILNPVNRWNSSRFISVAENDLKRLAKVPLHLAVIFTEKSKLITLDNLLELVSWCSAYRIYQVSIFDSKGDLRAKRCEIQASFQRIFQAQASSTSCLPHACDQTTIIPQPSDKLLKTLPLQAPSLSFLSALDGFPAIATAARGLCGDVLAGKIVPTSIDIDCVDRCIRDVTPISDPDLVVQIGAVDSLCGYPPWHVRLSEIRRIKTGSSITFDQFRSVLYKYSRVEQRFGR